MILASEIECFLYDVQSLKEKRAILQKLLSKIRRSCNFSVAEIGFQDQWQRTRIALVTVSESKKVAEREFQKVIALIDSFPELERTITEYEWL